MTSRPEADDTRRQVGARVRISWTNNALLHGETGTVIERTAPDEVVVKLDRITPAMMSYDDASRGLVTVHPANLIELP